MKQTADLLWRIDANSSAAILYKAALEENEQQDQLEATEVLDAYLCWGLCEIDENNAEEAHRIYQEAINRYIEPGMSAHGQNEKWIEYASSIHANMTYIYGIMADSERGSFEKQHQLRMEARAYIDKALELDGDNSSALHSSATLHYDCGEFTEALAGYERYREKRLSTEARLMAVRCYIEIRLEQLYDAPRSSRPSSITENLTSDLHEYSELFKSAKKLASSDQDILREIELARAILLNYDPEAGLYSF